MRLRDRILPDCDREAVALCKHRALEGLERLGGVDLRGASDNAYRAIAELVVDGAITFDEDRGRLEMTNFGRLVLNEMRALRRGGKRNDR